MKKVTILAIIAISLNLGLSAEIHDNVIIHKLPVEIQESIEQYAPAQHRATRGQQGPRTLAVGQSGDIALPANPTTGYTWHATCDPDGSFDIISRYEQGASNGMVGVGGTQIFTLTAKRAGRVSCTFEKGQSWDAKSYDGKPENTQKLWFQITK